MTDGKPGLDERPEYRQETVRIMRLNTGTKRAMACVAVLVVALGAVIWAHFSEKSEAAATIATLTADKTKSEAELKTLKDEREVAVKAEEAKRAAEAARPVMSGPAVLAQTLFDKKQFPIAEATVGAAANGCQVNGETPSLCMVRLWSKLHMRYATEVIAMTKSGMDERQAKDLATCLGQKLPKHDDGTSDDPAVVNLSGSKYKGQHCLGQETTIAAK